MAIYHLSVKTISRSSGRSATAAAAYRAGVKIADRRTGEIHDYTRKGGVVSSGLVVPGNAPEWADDRAELWNAAEQAETRKNSTVAREFEIALPEELSPAERMRLARDFAQEIVEWHGCAADVAIHAPSKEGDNRNHHAHILLSTRRLGPDGFGEKTRELDDKKTGPELVTQWRERFASLQNERLREAGLDVRVDHRTLEAQGIERAPTVHLGPAATGYERRTGERSTLRQRIDEATARLEAARRAGEAEAVLQQQEIIKLSTDLATARKVRDQWQGLPTIRGGRASVPHYHPDPRGPITVAIGEIDGLQNTVWHGMPELRLRDDHGAVSRGIQSGARAHAGDCQRGRNRQPAREPTQRGAPDMQSSQGNAVVDALFIPGRYSKPGKGSELHGLFREGRTRGQTRGMASREHLPPDPKDSIRAEAVEQAAVVPQKFGPASMDRILAVLEILLQVEEPERYLSAAMGRIEQLQDAWERRDGTWYDVDAWQRIGPEIRQLLPALAPLIDRSLAVIRRAEEAKPEAVVPQKIEPEPLPMERILLLMQVQLKINEPERFLGLAKGYIEQLQEAWERRDGTWNDVDDWQRIGPQFRQMFPSLAPLIDRALAVIRRTEEPQPVPPSHTGSNVPPVVPPRRRGP